MGQFIYVLTRGTNNFINLENTIRTLETSLAFGEINDISGLL